MYHTTTRHGGVYKALADGRAMLPPRMSALGQKQTFNDGRPMSALPPKADMDQHGRDVCFVPKADIAQPALVETSKKKEAALFN